MAKLSIADLELSGKCVLIRVDFNVPLSEAHEVTDDTRIRAALPTIRHAMERGAKVALISHLGRPKGKVVPSMSLAPAAARLARLLGRPVPMASDCMGEQVKAAVAALPPGGVLMLENCRFHAGDKKNDAAMSRALAELCDVFVNDAFGAAHRAHASTVGVTKFVPVSAAGFLMAKEIAYLGQAVQQPVRPFVAILGGAKVSDKIGVLKNLVAKVDALLVGGGMAYTFLKAQGMEVGASLLEADKLDVAREILEAARARGVTFLLPMDHVIAEKVDAASPTRIADSTDLPPGWMGLDIGPRAREAFATAILELDDSVPTGTYVDMCSKLPLVDPEKITSPTVIMRGQWDGIASVEDLIEFFKRLPNPDKQFAVMAGIAHASFQQKNYLTVYHILHAFFSQPEPVCRG